MNVINVLELYNYTSKSNLNTISISWPRALWSLQVTFHHNQTLLLSPKTPSFLSIQLVEEHTHAGDNYKPIINNNKDCWWVRSDTPYIIEKSKPTKEHNWENINTSDEISDRPLTEGAFTKPDPLGNSMRSDIYLVVLMIIQKYTRTNREDCWDHILERSNSKI